MPTLFSKECFFLEDGSAVNIVSNDGSDLRVNKFLSNAVLPVTFFVLQSHDVFAYVLANENDTVRLVSNDRLSYLLDNSMFCSRIVGLAMNRRFLVAVYGVQLTVYDIDSLRELALFRRECPEEGFVMDLANTASELVAFSETQTSGTLHVYDVFSRQKICTFTAHRSPIEAIKFSASDEMIATASVQGTVCRIFRAKTGQKLYEMRRGLTSACIHDLAFSVDNRFLACVSGNGTIHIFKLDGTKKQEETKSGGWFGWVSGHLAPIVTSALYYDRAFACARITSSTNALPDVRRKIRIVKRVNEDYKVRCIGTDDLLHEFSFDSTRGGESPPGVTYHPCSMRSSYLCSPEINRDLDEPVARSPRSENSMLLSSCETSTSEEVEIGERRPETSKSKYETRVDSNPHEDLPPVHGVSAEGRNESPVSTEDSDESFEVYLEDSAQLETPESKDDKEANGLLN